MRRSPGRDNRLDVQASVERDVGGNPDPPRAEPSRFYRRFVADKQHLRSGLKGLTFL